MGRNNDNQRSPSPLNRRSRSRHRGRSPLPSHGRPLSPHHRAPPPYFDRDGSGRNSKLPEHCRDLPPPGPGLLDGGLDADPTTEPFITDEDTRQFRIGGAATLRFPLCATKIDKVIGINGSLLRQIGPDNNCEVSFTPAQFPGERMEFVISGKPRDLDCAEHLARDLLGIAKGKNNQSAQDRYGTRPHVIEPRNPATMAAGHVPSNVPCDVLLECTEAMCGKIIGPNGRNLERIERDTRAEIRIPPADPAMRGWRLITVNGTFMECRDAQSAIETVVSVNEGANHRLVLRVRRPIERIVPDAPPPNVPQMQMEEPISRPSVQVQGQVISPHDPGTIFIFSFCLDFFVTFSYVNLSSCYLISCKTFV